MNGDTTILSAVLLILVPILGKAVQWLVNLYKQSPVIAGASNGVKQFLGWLSAAIIGWVVGALAIHLTGTSIDTLTPGDVGLISTGVVTKGVLGLLVWFNSMLFHNATKQ